MLSSCYHSDRKLAPEERNECKRNITGPALRLKGLKETMILPSGKHASVPTFLSLLQASLSKFVYS